MTSLLQFCFLTRLITSKMKVKLKRLRSKTYLKPNKLKSKNLKRKKWLKDKSQKKDLNSQVIHNLIKLIYLLQVLTISKPLLLKNQFLRQIQSYLSIWKVWRKILTSEIFLKDTQDGFYFVESIIDHLRDVIMDFMQLTLS